MPPRPHVPLGAPIWLDLGTPDLQRTVAFYTALFGWEHVSFGPELGDYGSFLRDGAPVAGVGPLDGDGDGGDDGGGRGDGQRPAWSVYLRTADADASAAAATAAGGSVVVPPADVPGQGRFLFAADPAGVAVGFWQPAGHDGYAVSDEHGAPAWFELWTDRYDVAVPFYEQAAGWTLSALSDTPEMRYTTLRVDGEDYAGIFDATASLAAGRAPSWAVYLGADDVDATTARVVELGGSVLTPPQDSPYGRTAGVLDPTGAWFQLISV